jgi:hypothetical protein
MGRLVLVLLVSLLTSDDVLAGKTTGRHVDNTAMAAEGKTQLTTAPTSSTRHVD